MALTSVGMVAVGCVVWWGVAPGDIPIRMLVALHEGSERNNLEVARGWNTHAGSLLSAVFGLGRGSTGDLRDTVHLNLALLAASTVGVAATVRGITGRAWVAVLLAVVFAANGAMRVAVLSESPAAVVSFVFVCTAPAYLLGRDPEADGTRRGGLSLAALVLCAGVLAGIRPELAFLPAWVVAVRLVRWRFGEVGIAQGLHAAATRLGEQFARRPVRVVAGLVLLTIMADLAGLVTGGPLGVSIRASNPMSMLIVPGLIFLLALTPGVVVALILVGLVRLVQRAVTTDLLVVPALVLVRLYVVSSHGVIFELLRYLAPLMVLAVWMAALGVHELDERILVSREPRRWRAVALGAGLLLVMVPAPHGFGARLTPDPVGTIRRGRLPGLPNTIQQEEVRLLVWASDTWPGCDLVALVTESDHGHDRHGPYLWSLLSANVPGEQTAPVALVGLDAFLTRSSAPCVLFYEGQDCNLDLARDACASVTGSHVQLARMHVPFPTYNDPEERGPVRGDASLGLYLLRGEASPVDPTAVGSALGPWTLLADGQGVSRWLVDD